MFFKIDKINTFFFKNMQPYCVLLHLVVKTLRAKIFSRLISYITPKPTKLCKNNYTTSYFLCYYYAAPNTYLHKIAIIHPF
jgi:hypothetical protein